MTSPTSYSLPQIALHWVVAVVIAAQYLLDDGIGEAWHAVRDGLAPTYGPLVLAHIVGGVLVLALVAWRLGLRLRHGAPPPPEDEHPALQKAAKATHWALYALLIILPVSGLVAWFGGIRDAAEVHEILTNVLLGLVGLHVAAALFHHFVLKSEVMRRMVRPTA
ncbi:MAG: cytochrome b [Alphaproteobacteria bacterium]